MALVTQYIMHASKGGEVDTRLAIEGGIKLLSSSNKIEHFSYKGE